MMIKIPRAEIFTFLYLYVFTPVCQSFCSEGGVVPGQVPQAGTPPGRYIHPPGLVHPSWAGTLPGRYTPIGRYNLLSRYNPPGRYIPLGRYKPRQCMLGYGQQVGGTHPTGMHSCYGKVLLSKYICGNFYFVIYFYNLKVKQQN